MRVALNRGSRLVVNSRSSFMPEAAEGEVQDCKIPHRGYRVRAPIEIRVVFLLFLA